jgi:hypothetical protein
MTMILRAALCLAVAAAHNATAVHHAASRGGRSRATTSLLVVLAIVCCAVAACLKSKRTTLVEDPEKPLDVSVHIDEESKESPDELSESRHAKPIKPVEAVPEKVRAVSFDIEQPVVSPLTESRASASKWSLAKPST